MSQALYRKYRSRSLDEVVGQEHITETLARAIQAGHIGHAYLFTGPRGTGKTSVARILAHEINQLPYSDATQLDIVEIDAASNRRIDDIRDLREKVHIAPVNAKYKVYIIDEVHMLTGESFNALLKTLEEPPSHVVFILATTEVHKLPATIISRTQRFAFRPGTKDKIVAHLKMIAKKEKMDIEDAALDIIAEHGEGSYRDSLSLLDQLTHVSDGAITAGQVSQTLGLAAQEQIQKLIQAIADGNTQQILDITKAIEDQGSNATATVNQLAKSLLATKDLQPDFLALIDKLLDIPRAYNPQLKLISTLATFRSIPSRAPIAAVKQSTPAVVVEEKKSSPALVTLTPPLTITSEPLESLAPNDWAQILNLTKEKSPPLFAILKQAQPLIADSKLTLKFKFSLMAKKLDDPNQKALVAGIVQQVTDKSPSINVIVDKTAVPPPAPDNPHVAKVTEIMGGGEIVHAETI